MLTVVDCGARSGALRSPHYPAARATATERILHPGLAGKIMRAAPAAELVQPGMTVAMSGFTGAGYPKAVPQALAARMETAAAAGHPFKIKVLTGASTAPELDGALARVEGMELRLPYQSDPAVRER